MIARMVSTVAGRRSERPLLVTTMGWGFCALPLMIGIVVLLAAAISGAPFRVNGAGEIAGLLGAAGVFTLLALLLGYGLLALTRASYWILLGVVALGCAVYLVDDLRAGRFSISPLLNLVWIGYLLQPAVRRAFRY